MWDFVAKGKQVCDDSTLLRQHAEHAVEFFELRPPKWTLTGQQMLNCNYIMNSVPPISEELPTDGRSCKVLWVKWLFYSAGQGSGPTVSTVAK